MMQDRRLFITGINGLIGRVLQSGLDELYDIWGLDCAGPFTERVIQANIRDYEQVIRAFRQASPFRYLVHLAANPSVDAKWELILQDNIHLFAMQSAGSNLPATMGVWALRVDLLTCSDR